MIGERWTWLIIRDAFLGLTRFVEFGQSLGIVRNVLTDRLNRLVEEGSSSACSTKNAQQGTSTA